MPQKTHLKFKPRPPTPPPIREEAPPYAELQVTTNFTFLSSGSHPEEFIAQAHALGYRGIAVTDINSLAGVVRAHITAKELGIPFRVGCSLELLLSETTEPNSSISALTATILVYPTDRSSYGRLCRLITKGKLRTDKRNCWITLSELLEHGEGLLCIIVHPLLSGSNRELISKLEICVEELCQRLASSPLRSGVYLAIQRLYTAQSIALLHRITSLAERYQLPTVVTNDARCHTADRRPLFDIVTCIRTGTTLEQAGFLLPQNSERYLKPAAEMHRLFQQFPDAIRRTIEILDRTAGFSLDQLRYEYPTEVCPPQYTAQQYLRELAMLGAHARYPEGIPTKVLQTLEEEFTLIAELKYEQYFLTCYKIVTFARSQGILCQGRGAAANSAVCFCLGITSVDPSKIDLLFARFVSKERNEPPDIDIDFEHERREEVMQYIYTTFGRERAGLTAAVITYRMRSAVREVGKVFGLPLTTVDALAKLIHRWNGSQIPPEDLQALGLHPQDPTIVAVMEFAQQLRGFPRHLTQHVGGFIICQHPLCESVPILNSGMESRTIIEWDKDDIEALGMLKIDVLALGMLTAIRKGLELINRRRILNAEDSLYLHTIPAEDPAVYDMVCAADTVGVFQIESRAQMSMLPRLKPRCFYDLVIEVAIVRPGPVQGNMVHPYLRRRSGVEKPFFPDARVRDVLGKTLGVPIFQEQAMRLAIVLANFTPGEAELLRRAMAAWKRDKGKIATFEERIVRGMVINGYTAEFAHSCVNQIKGFSEYGFPESHAASFALLVYASAWMKRHYPAEFCVALLNSQPMGFYTPSQLVADAQSHGVAVLPIDTLRSRWDATIEGQHHAVRLGLRLISGLAQQEAEAIIECASASPPRSIEQLWIAVQHQAPFVRRRSFELLADADAFAALGVSAREARWQVLALKRSAAPLLEPLAQSIEQPPALPQRSVQQEMFTDYRTTGVSLKAHPMQFVRERLQKAGVRTAAALRDKTQNRLNSIVRVAGIAVTRQRPGTAKGVVFISLEDETGVCNLVVRPQLYERFRRVITLGRCLLVEGKLERIDAVVYISATHLQTIDDAVLPNDTGDGITLKSYSY